MHQNRSPARKMRAPDSLPSLRSFSLKATQNIVEEIWQADTDKTYHVLTAQSDTPYLAASA